VRRFEDREKTTAHGRTAFARIAVAEADGEERLAREMLRTLGEVARARDPCMIVLCVGSDRSTGDSLGPVVGSMLLESGLADDATASPRPLRRPGLYALGNLDRPVHAANLAEAVELLQPARAVVIAVDACLGSADSVGSVVVGRGPLRPGAGVNKALPPVGDMFIAATVNVGGFMEYFVLQNTRLSLVLGMATVISRALLSAAAAHLGLDLARASGGGCSGLNHGLPLGAAPPVSPRLLQLSGRPPI